MSCQFLLDGLLKALHSSYEIVEGARELGWRLTLDQIIHHPDPLVVCIFLCAAAVLVCWVWSFNGNCSHVDRMWSILPIFYVGIFAREELSTAVEWLRRGGKGAAVPDLRLLVQWVLVLVWGCRLTYNFARKGGYNLATEDYRWEEVRKMFGGRGLLFQIFNLVFIALAQNVLLLGITTPAYIAWLQDAAEPFGTLDYVATLMFLLYLSGETLADQQQWNFQHIKRALILKRQTRYGDYARGFLASGLFRYSRHPNFFCEMALWWSFLLFGIAAAPACPINWTIAPAIALVALFNGSTWVTEKMSAAKYPRYRAYQRVTSRIIPWFPSGALDAKETKQA